MEFYTELLNSYRVIKKKCIGNNIYNYTHVNHDDISIILTQDSDTFGINFSTGLKILDSNTLFFYSVEFEYVDFFIKTLLISIKNVREILLCILKNKSTIFSSKIFNMQMNSISWYLMVKPKKIDKKNIYITFSIYKEKTKLEHTLNIKTYSLESNSEISLGRLRENVY